MSGNPAAKPNKKVYAYLLVDCELQTDENIDIGGYVPQNPPMLGTITLREDNPGTGTHVFIFEDGPLKYVTSGVYIGTGEELPSGAVEFDWGVSSLIRLIQLGADAHNSIRATLHDFADKTKEIVEELDDRAELDPERAAKEIDTLERNWFKAR